MNLALRAHAVRWRRVFKTPRFSALALPQADQLKRQATQQPGEFAAPLPTTRKGAMWTALGLILKTGRACVFTAGIRGRGGEGCARWGAHNKSETDRSLARPCVACAVQRAPQPRHAPLGGMV